MTTDAYVGLFENHTDAAFREWTSRVSQMLSNLGLVKTADTGQINFTTVVRNLSSNSETIAGYEIFRFNDTLQGSKPIFLKIEYGLRVENCNGGFPGAPVMYATVGTATNGAGSLTGLLLTSRQRITGVLSGVNVSGPSVTRAGTATASTQVYGFSDGSSLALAFGIQSTPQAIWAETNNSSFLGRRVFPAFFSIERIRNADGTPNADGVQVMWSGWVTDQSAAEPANPTVRHQIISFTGAGVSTLDGGWPITWPGAGLGTANLGGDIYFSPTIAATPKPQAQSLLWLGTWRNDVPFLSTQMVTINGVTRPYMSLAGIAGVTANDNARSYINATTPLGALMMRYE